MKHVGLKSISSFAAFLVTINIFLQQLIFPLKEALCQRKFHIFFNVTIVKYVFLWAPVTNVAQSSANHFEGHMLMMLALPLSQSAAEDLFRCPSFLNLINYFQNCYFPPVPIQYLLWMQSYVFCQQYSQDRAQHLFAT